MTIPALLARPYRGKLDSEGDLLARAGERVQAGVDDADARQAWIGYW